MTDTTRTTVTLTESYMEKVEILVGNFAASRAQVISKIVEKFLDSPKYFTLKDRINEDNKKKETEKIFNEAKRPEVIDRKIKNIISGVKRLSLESFLSYIKIDKDFFYDNIAQWKEKYNIVEDNGILEIKK